MKFTVEMPIYVTAEVESDDPNDAALALESLVRGRDDVDILFGSTLSNLFGTVRDIHIVPLAPGEDDLPDVYFCRGGKLAAVEPNGFVVPLNEDCAAPS